MEVLAIVDTAASHKVVNASALSIDPVVEHRHNNGYTKLGAEGFSMKIVGRAQITMRLNGREFACTVFISPDLCESLLLGLLWLREQNGIIDVVRDLLHIGTNDGIRTPLVGLLPSRREPQRFRVEDLQYDFTKQLSDRFVDVIRTHAPVFVALGQGLAQTRTMRHGIQLQLNGLFRCLD